EKGIIQPILVRELEPGRYQLVAGERRWRSTVELGIEKIPAYIKVIESDEDMMEIALIENVQREHLNPIDLALGYQRLIDDCGLTQEEVARRIGKDRTTITNVIRLLKLPDRIQESLAKGEIREGHARALLRITNAKLLDKIWQRTVKESLSVRAVEELARKAEETQKAENGKLLEKRRKPPYIGKVETKLREKLGTQVKLRTKKEGGTIEVTFYSGEDLERLMDIFEKINF
ncbi:MAG TPA: ParB/RepB/Spo0J family partition protein, partial [Calditrichia bacterium]|nr:ParB/RepB/Spo0J family partition protein [Calditrichia bacterium]